MSRALPMTAVQREIVYIKQNGGDPFKESTPAQQKRARQKKNRRIKYSMYVTYLKEVPNE